MKHNNMTILNSCHTQKVFIFYSLMNQQIQVVLHNIFLKKSVQYKFFIIYFLLFTTF